MDRLSSSVTGSRRGPPPSESPPRWRVCGGGCWWCMYKWSHQQTTPLAPHQWGLVLTIFCGCWIRRVCTTSAEVVLTMPDLADTEHTGQVGHEKPADARLRCNSMPEIDKFKSNMSLWWDMGLWWWCIGWRWLHYRIDLKDILYHLK